MSSFDLTSIPFGDVPARVNAALGEVAQREADLTSSLAAVTAERDRLAARVGELEAQIPKPVLPGVGVYNGNPGEQPDETTVREFGTRPDVANSYYQSGTLISAKNLAYEVERIKRGTSPNLAVSTKGTQLVAGIANGDAAALAWLDKWIAVLVQLAKVDPKVKVYGTFDAEHRGHVKAGELTGASADPAVYGKALQVFFDRIAATGLPNLVATWWLIGYDREFEGRTSAAFKTAPPLVVFDPYANTPADTIATITKADIAWFKSQPWWKDGQPLALGEFGMPVRNGDEGMGAFFADLRGQFKQAGLSWGVFFNRERDNDHKIIDRTDGRQFPKAVAAFSGSLAAGADAGRT